MKFSLLAAALMALTLAACDRPKQADPASIENYGQITEDGTTMAESREAEGPVSEVADPEKFKLKDAMQAEEAAEVAAAETAEGAAAETTEGGDEYSGKAVLPSHNLDGNGNPITDGKDPTKLMH